MQRSGPLSEAEAAHFEEIAEKIMLGRTLKEIEADGGPSVALVLSWLRRDKEAERFYNACRKVSAYALEDEALHVSRNTHEREKVTTNELRNSEQYQKALRESAKVRNPEAFGDKVQTQISVPVTINTPLDLGGDSQKSELGNAYEVKAIVKRTVHAAETPEDATPVLGPDGEIVLVEEGAESAGSSEGAEEPEPSAEADPSSRVQRDADGGGTEGGESGEVPKAESAEDRGGHRGVEGVPRGKAKKVSRKQARKGRRSGEGEGG